MQVEARAFASTIGPVSGRDQAHALCGASPKVADAICTLLDVVRSETIVVINDCVVRRAHGALQACVCLQVIVEVVDARHTLIDDCSSFRVARAIGVVHFHGIETRMMPLATDGDGDFRTVILEPANRFTQTRELLLNHLVELTLEIFMSIFLKTYGI